MFPFLRLPDAQEEGAEEECRKMLDREGRREGEGKRHRATGFIIPASLTLL